MRYSKPSGSVLLASSVAVVASMTLAWSALAQPGEGTFTRTCTYYQCGGSQTTGCSHIEFACCCYNGGWSCHCMTVTECQDKEDTPLMCEQNPET